MPKQTPLIVKSELTKPARWFVLTRYRQKSGVVLPNGERRQYVVASEKFDVTDQMRVILRAEKRRAR